MDDAPIVVFIFVGCTSDSREWNAYDLSTTSWAFAVRWLPLDPMLASLDAKSRQVKQKWSSQDISGIAWSVALLAFGDMPFINSLAAESRTSGEADVFRPQRLANIAWSCAVLN